MSSAQITQKSAHSSYRSFQCARRGKWGWPAMHEVHDLMRHPHGIMLLAFFLLFNYSLASLTAGVPVSAQRNVFSDDWLPEVGFGQRLNRRYHAEAPLLVAAYLKARGAFAAQMAEGTATAEAAAAWQAAAREIKDQLLAMKVPSSLKEVHLGLVVAIGLDEVAANELYEAYAGGKSNRRDAEAAFAAALDRLTMVLQSNPWLTR